MCLLPLVVVKLLLLRRADRWTATHGACTAQMVVHKELLGLRLPLSRTKDLGHASAQPTGPAVPSSLLLLMLLLILHAALAAVAVVSAALSDLLDKVVSS